jgi:hypothetical protein
VFSGPDRQEDHRLEKVAILPLVVTATDTIEYQASTATVFEDHRTRVQKNKELNGLRPCTRPCSFSPAALSLVANHQLVAPPSPPRTS